MSSEPVSQDEAGRLVLLASDLGEDFATSAAVHAATGRPGVWRDLHPDTPPQEHDEGFVAARELGRMLIPAVREALGAARVANEPGFIRYPEGADTLEEHSGTQESLAALDRLVDDLLRRLLADDLGFEFLATRRDKSGHVLVEGDRWGMLRLAGEALRLAAGRGAATAPLDAGSYLQNIEDIVILKRVPTPPRWWNDDEKD
jgi:hypothetical protein